MKKALILHGTSSNSNSNWFPWLKAGLENAGWKVWVPDLPNSDEPNVERYNKHIFENNDWSFDDETVLIGHSSGAVEVLGLLQELDENMVVKQSILIGSFKDDLGWPNLGGLFVKPFDFAKIKQRSKSFVFIHSDNDPYCPLDHAEYLCKELSGELKVLPGQKHFSEETDPRYTTFPLLKDILLKNS